MATEKFFIIEPSGAQDQWIISTAIGGDYFHRWDSTMRPMWEEFGRRFGIGIAVAIDNLFDADEPKRHGAWQKLLAPKALRQVLRRDFQCLLLDSDILISPGADNVFDLVPRGKIGVVSQEFNVPSGEPRKIRRRMAQLRRRYLDEKFPLQSALTATPGELAEWAGLPKLNDYFCSGVIVLDSASHSDFLKECYLSAPSSNAYTNVDWGEELWLNSKFSDRSDVLWLGYEWQTLWAFEVAQKYPFLYSSEFPEQLVDWCIGASLLNCNFLHLAGSWESDIASGHSPQMPEISDFNAWAQSIRSAEVSLSHKAISRGQLPPPATKRNFQPKP